MTMRRARTLLPLLGTLFLGSALAGYGCGGSSGGDNVALCNNLCNKANSLCVTDSGPITIPPTDCATTCTPAMVAQKTTNCPNASAIVSALNACLAKTTCADLVGCEAALPQCGGGGTAGTSGGTAGTSGGTAGTSGGTAGTSGGTAGTSGTSYTCADLLACCNAVSDATLKAACMTEYTSFKAMAMGDTLCGTLLTNVKATYCP
jgi:hypothetical protein